MREEITAQFKTIQDNICKALENTDGKATFKEELWDREGGGGGRTRVIANGNILEKGAVNFSAVHGHLPNNIREKLGLACSDFYATGVSLIMHSHNPHVPTVHMNIRYFELKDGTYWFGGGIDLTPTYIDTAEASIFHAQLKEVCDKHDKDFYPKYKAWADDYFFIPFRNETRGVGGIFLDHLKECSNHSKKDIFKFVSEIGYSFAPIYTQIMTNKASKTYSDQQKDWQLHRRGRYVEFNLVLDKGTKFGLDTNGRTESILVSMPPEVKWTYEYPIEKGSEEEKTLNLLKKGINWFEFENEIV